MDGGPVLEAARPERLVFQWSPGGPGYPTTVELTFQRVTEGTVVRVRGHGDPATAKALAVQLDCAAGWGEALALAKRWVEQGLRA